MRHHMDGRLPFRRRLLTFLTDAAEELARHRSKTDRLLDLAAARIRPRTFNTNVSSGRFLSCDFYSSLRSARAIGTGGAGCMGVARAASERACVHPD